MLEKRNEVMLVDLEPSAKDEEVCRNMVKVQRVGDDKLFRTRREDLY